MSYQEIRYELADRMATITLDRPDRLNAWTPRMGEEVRDAMRLAADDDAVRVIVLTGAGRGFCAGADMTTLSRLTAERGSSAAAPAPSPSDPRSRRDFQKRYSYFPAVGKPIIAAVNGPCAD
jgi:enoyl-CoA hydratase/carnithine racemase